MVETINEPRRRLVAAALTLLAAAEVAMPSRAHANAFASLKQVDAGPLSVAYVDEGPRDGPVAILLHGWPYDIHAFEEVVPLLTAAGFRVIAPYLRGYGPTRFLSSDTPRNGEQAALAQDVIDLMDALGIQRAVVGGFDWGARSADIVAALWPERFTGVVAVSGYIVVNRKANEQPLPPAAELGWWYQYYFATERGRTGYDRNRHDFNKLIWKIASPTWNFDDATYDRSAAAFDNPDHVDIVIHNYRWRLGLAQGEARYADVERAAEAGPVIRIPAITLGSDFDGANISGAGYAAKFTGTHSHRILKGIGHNVPQEAPREFAQAVIDVGASRT